MSDEPKNEDLKYDDAGEDGGSGLDLNKRIKALKEKLEQANKEKHEYLTGWQRAQADFINYKRRQENMMAEWIKISKEEIVADILPVLDALETKGKKEHDEGLASLEKQLFSILKRHGLEEIKALGEKFNPQFHEAIEQVESNKGEGIIVEELQKGYKLSGKIIRSSKVKVSK
ncbi:MAG: Protein GrpE [Parcubacteria group bacterium GW2011_GWC1_43_12]|nr:MAG: Protein GrpE [Parcubacteria group bacterium GW2011_GWC1_43_12]